jgi:hypothetical protein
MILRVDARNFRCLRSVGHPLSRFNVLVGPNASGKTTFLDIVSFLGDLVNGGPEQAVGKRTDSVYDLLWNSQGDSFQLGIEAKIPPRVLAQIPEGNKGEKYDRIKYSVKIGFLGDSTEFGILGERVVLLAPGDAGRDLKLFPAVSEHVYSAEKVHGGRNVVHKREGSNDNFYSEVYPNKGKGWLPSFKFGPKKSALGNLPDDGRRFPASTWLKDFLTVGVTELTLNSLLIRKPSPPGAPSSILPDGSNLPWVIDHLFTERPGVFNEWLEHIRVALPDIKSVHTVLKDDDRHRYLVLEYADSSRVPSWFVSDGTLRFLSLTLLAYLPHPGTTYLIEEPENGLHPPIVEPLIQSLSSVYESQVLIATHSPVALSLVDTQDLLCFSRNHDGTSICPGNLHPGLKDWKGEVSLGTLIASGILGQ